MVGGVSMGALVPLAVGGETMIRRLHGGIAPFAGARHGRSAPSPQVLLVDQLGAIQPGSRFQRDLEAVIGGAGRGLRVVPPDEATVGRFRSLPADGASLIVLRVHSALIVDRGRWTDDVALFTNEPVDLSRFAVSGLVQGPSPSWSMRPASPGTGSNPPKTRLTPAEIGALVPVRRTVGTDLRPFNGLGATFIRDHLDGSFRDDAVVVLMGCDGLRGVAMSEAFLARGARAVIGWSDEVSAGHTDKATLELVAELSAGGTVTSAIRRAMIAVGRDPVSGAYLIAAER